MISSTPITEDRTADNELPDLFADLSDVVEYGVKYIGPFKRTVFEGEAKEQLASAVDALSNLAMKYANGNREQLRDICHDVRSNAEEIVRFHRLRHPASEEQLFSDIAWAGEQRSPSVLGALKALLQKLPRNGMGDLIEHAIDQIDARAKLSTGDHDDTEFPLAHRRMLLAMGGACLALAAVGLIWLPASPLGFCLTFGGALVGYECFLVWRYERK